MKKLKIIYKRSNSPPNARIPILPLSLPCRVLYHTSFAKPYDGYKSLSSNLKWVNYRPETVLHDPYLKRDDHLDIKTSIMDYHRLTGEVPGFPEYHIPS